MAKQAGRPAQTRSQARPQTSNGPEVVDPSWLLRMLGLVVVVALLCGYATFCGLFYFGQWQLIMHPQRGGAVPAQIDGSAVQTFRIEPDASGVPQVTAWSIPASANASYGRYTALVLPAAEGSLATQQPLLVALHQLGFAVFAMDYRGFGGSAEGRPSQEKMQADAAAALRYLTDERHISADTIVPVGAGFGASLAVALASGQHALPAVMLIAPDGDTLERVRKDERAAPLPVRLLLRDRFPLAEPLKTLTTPKLIADFTDGSLPEAVRKAAASPKTTVELPGKVATELTGKAFHASASGFLDSYLTAGPAVVALP